MEKKIANVTCPACGASLDIVKTTNGTAAHQCKPSATSRLEALKGAGVDVTNIFAMVDANGVSVLARIENGRAETIQDDDPIFRAILADGSVPNRKLFRRWVMAQMFHMLTEKETRRGQRRGPIGFTEALHRKGYGYQWKVLVNELNAQASMYRNGDMENFIARNRWFNKEVAIELAESYMSPLKNFVGAQPTRKCKGVPYKRVFSQNIFVDDLYSKLYRPLYQLISAIERADDPTALHLAVKRFNDQRHSLPWNTKQNATWVDAYKGSGAYFTLQNMIRFHGCFLIDDAGKQLSKEGSLIFLDEKAKLYEGEGWRLLGLLKKALDDNNIDIEDKIASWRKK